MITLNLHTRELRDGERHVRLPPQLCKMLVILSGGKEVRFGDMIAGVWPHMPPGNPEATLKLHVSWLRTRAKIAGMPPLILSMGNVGFSLIRPIHLLERIDLDAPAAARARARAPVGVMVCKCSCGATVVPHARERLPVRCSTCRANRVEQIIRGRALLAAD